MKDSASIRVAVLIIQAGKLLTMRYTYGQKQVHTLPGGNLEFGEELRDTAKRELMEELQIAVEIAEEPILTAQVDRNGKTTHHILYEASILEGTPKLNPAETSAESVGWLSLEQLDKTHLYPAVGEALISFYNKTLKDQDLGIIEQPFF